MRLALGESESVCVCVRRERKASDTRLGDAKPKESAALWLRETQSD